MSEIGRPDNDATFIESDESHVLSDNTSPNASPADLQKGAAGQLENAEAVPYEPDGAEDENKVLKGEWEGARWEFHTSKEFPPDIPCTAAGCVVLYESKVLLTRDDSKAIGDARRGNWEIPAGHADPVEPDDPQSPLETPEATTRRETLEEGGAVLGDLHPFGYRMVYNLPSPNKTERQAKYPDESYMAYYWSFATSLQEPTEEDRHTSQVFSAEEVETLYKAGKISETEFQIIRQGLAAAHNETNHEPSPGIEPQEPLR